MYTWTLILVGVNFNLHDLQSLLEFVPEVSHLHLPIRRDMSDHNIGNELQDPILCHLADTMDGPGLFVPRLRILELSTIESGLDTQWDTFAAIVASLCQADRQVLPHRRPLKTFRFNIKKLRDTPIPASTRKKIYELTQAGAEIVVNEEVVVVSQNDLEEEEEGK
ncbi:hypothetical protein CPC08DRAFT_729721 [Agrocybe pediades]|nr:hypothetical protein CPC08DRAFT_729721 [Agrocybe pediades]